MKKLVAVGIAVIIGLVLGWGGSVRAQLFTTICKTITQNGAVIAKCKAPRVPGVQSISTTGSLVTNSDSATVGSVVASTGCNGATPAFQPYGAYPATWVPYACPPNGIDGVLTGNSPINRKISANPTFLANSATEIATMFNGWTGFAFRTGDGDFDSGHAMAFASSTDPQVTVTCTFFCATGGAPDYGGPGNGGTITFRIPANTAFPGNASEGCESTDHHLIVAQPVTGLEVGMFFANAGNSYCNLGFGGTPWQNGHVYTDSLHASLCGPAWNGPSATSTGWMSNNPNGSLTGTAGGMCDGAGQVRAEELVAGVIHHALALTLNCGGNTSQFPAPPGANSGPCQDSNVPLGAPLWIDVSDATILAMTIQPYQKAILMALHDYGGYYMDNGCGGTCFIAGKGFGIELLSGEEYRDFGASNPYAALASQGWSSITAPGTTNWTRWGSMGFGSNEMFGQTVAWLQAHAHWLAPCAAQGTC